MEIKELDKNLIELANHCSFNGNRGKLREESYKSYVESILSWNISDNKKQKIFFHLKQKAANMFSARGKTGCITCTGAKNARQKILKSAS